MSSYYDPSRPSFGGLLGGGRTYPHLLVSILSELCPRRLTLARDVCTTFRDVVDELILGNPEIRERRRRKYRDNLTNISDFLVRSAPFEGCNSRYALRIISICELDLNRCSTIEVFYYTLK